MLLELALVAMQVSATPVERFGFDYRAADITTYAVSRFEMQVDGQPWTDLGLPAGETRPDTTPGHETRSVAIPPLTPGNHTVSFRACNPTACSEPTAPLAFVLVVQPPSPSAPRIVR